MPSKKASAAGFRARRRRLHRPRLANLLNTTDKEAQKRGDRFIASEMSSRR
ncbi:MAG: hypothetical protein IPO50_15875 [Sphingomonadales bacterium]|nr:hypothetical protein [Sphingomonadales bacterium]